MVSKEEQQAAEAKMKRIENFIQIKKETPQFQFMDKVDIINGFYKPHKGIVYNEIDVILDPSGSDDSIIKSYQLLILNEKDEVIDKRVVEAKDLQLI